jgi:hypothetical protein
MFVGFSMLLTNMLSGHAPPGKMNVLPFKIMGASMGSF